MQTISKIRVPINCRNTGAVNWWNFSRVKVKQSGWSNCRIELWYTYMHGCFPGPEGGCKVRDSTHTKRVASRLEHTRSRTYVRSCCRVLPVYGGGARVQRVALCHNVAVLGACARRWIGVNDPGVYTNHADDPRISIHAMTLWSWRNKFERYRLFIHSILSSGLSADN